MSVVEQVRSLTQEQPQSNLRLEDQLARARTELDIMYMQFRLIVGNIDNDPNHYKNLNIRSAEIAQQHKIVAGLRWQLLGRSALNDDLQK